LSHTLQELGTNQQLVVTAAYVAFHDKHAKQVDITLVWKTYSAMCKDLKVPLLPLVEFNQVCDVLTSYSLISIVGEKGKAKGGKKRIKLNVNDKDFFFGTWKS